MDTTPALRNNWDFATAPSPQSVLGTSLAPIAGAVDSYNQRAFESHLQSVAAQNAQRLEQVKMDAAFRNIAARDKALLAWHDAADAARVQAAGEKGVADARNLSVKFAQDRNLPVLPMQPNETVEAYTARQNAANTVGAASRKTSKVAFYKQQMLGLADVYNKGLALRQTVNKEAGDLVTSSADSWVGQQDPADPRVIAYNTAKKRGVPPAQAIASSGLGPQWQQYAQSQMGLMQEKIMSDKGYDKNLEYIKAQAQQYAARLQQAQKTDPDYADSFVAASQSIVDDNVAATKKLNDAANAARAGGNTDPQTQAQLDAAAKAAQDAAAKADAAHQQLKVSLGASFQGGAPAPVRDTARDVPSLANMPKEALLAQLGATLDQNNQVQSLTPKTIANPSTGMPIATAPPPVENLGLINAIISSPHLAWKNPRPGLPGIQPGQTNAPAAPLPSTGPVTGNPFTLPRFSVADLINSGAITGPTAPAPTAAAPAANTGLVLPSLSSSDDTAAGLLQQNSYLAQQLTQ